MNAIIDPVKKFLQKDHVDSREAAKVLVDLCKNLNAMVQINNTASDLYNKTIGLLRNERGIIVNREKLGNLEKWIKHYERKEKKGIFGKVDILKMECELEAFDTHASRKDYDEEENEKKAEYQVYVKAFVSGFTGAALCAGAYCMRRTVVLSPFAVYVDGVGMTFIADAISQFRSTDTVEPPPERNMKKTKKDRHR